MLDASRILIDGGILALIMSAFILATLRYNPRLLLNDYPPDVMAAVPEKTPAEKRLSVWLGIPFILVSFVLTLASTLAFSGRVGPEAPFWALFVHALGVVGIPFLVDLVILDWLLFCTFTPSFVVIPGSEGMAGYKDYGFHLKVHSRASAMIAFVALVIAAVAAALGP